MYTVPTNPQQLNVNEKHALLDFYHSTSGRHWHTGQWTSQLAGDPCNGWYGVYCNEAGSVTKLKLSRNGLTGSLPRSLGKLTALDEVDLSENALTGAVPDTVTQLVRLKRLHLSTNSMRHIPSTIAQLPRLRYLSLHANAALKIPAEIVALGQLGQCPPRGGRRCCSVSYDAAGVA